MLTSGGGLLVRARWCPEPLAGRVGLEVALQRPRIASSFAGLSPEEVLARVPRLFSLCAQAQGMASAAALAGALESALPPVETAALWIEFLHENLWRLLLDWPLAVGVAPAREAFVKWRGQRHSAEVLAATESLRRVVLAPLADQCLAALPPAAETGLEMRLPHVEAAGDWLAAWSSGAGGGAALPTQVPPLSIRAAYRQRLLAVEVAAAALRDAKPYPLSVAGGGGRGVAQVLTARGVLTHAVQVGGGRQVLRYDIEAPTDCFFASAAPLASLVATCDPSSLDQTRCLVNQAILALDPCVPYTLELQDA